MVLERVASNFLGGDFGFRLQPNENVLTTIIIVGAKNLATSTKQEPK
jgi:hypothetical protein